MPVFMTVSLTAGINFGTACLPRKHVKLSVTFSVRITMVSTTEGCIEYYDKLKVTLSGIFKSVCNKLSSETIDNPHYV